MADETCVQLLLSCVPSNGRTAEQYNASRDVVAQNPGYVVATLLALTGIAIAYVLYRRSLRPKILDYDVDVDSPMLASASRRVRHELSVSWKGELVDEPKIIEVVIANTGKDAVVRGDYSDPVTITVSSGRLLEATLRDSRPEQAVKPDEVRVRGDNTSVAVLPQLLNKGDRFRVQLVVDGFGAKIAVSISIQESRALNAKCRPCNSQGIQLGAESCRICYGGRRRTGVLILAHSRRYICMGDHWLARAVWSSHRWRLWDVRLSAVDGHR